MGQFPPSPRDPLRQLWIFSKIRRDILFASQGAPPVSTTPVANFQFRYCCWHRQQICRRYHWHRLQICHRYQQHRQNSVLNLTPVWLIPVAICHRCCWYRQQFCRRCHQCCWHRWCTLTDEYLQIFEKIRNGPNGILWGWAETDPWKKPEAKSLVALTL